MKVKDLKDFFVSYFNKSDEVKVDKWITQGYTRGDGIIHTITLVIKEDEHSYEGHHKAKAHL